MTDEEYLHYLEILAEVITEKFPNTTYMWTIRPKIGIEVFEKDSKKWVLSVWITESKKSLGYLLNPDWKPDGDIKGILLEKSPLPLEDLD